MAALQIDSEILSQISHEMIILKNFSTAVFQFKPYKEQAYRIRHGMKGFSWRTVYDQFNGYNKYSQK